MNNSNKIRAQRNKARNRGTRFVTLATTQTIAWWIALSKTGLARGWIPILRAPPSSDDGVTEIGVFFSP